MPLKLYKRGKIWHYAGTVAGDRLRGSTKTAQKPEAEKIANEVERRKLERHRHGISATLTFAQAAFEYRRQERFLDRTPKYLELVEDHWRNTLVKEITGGTVRRAALTILPSGSGAYRNRAVLVPTQAVINYCAALDMCHYLKVKRFEEKTARKVPATWDWVQAFMAHASPHLGALACFMFCTGARISEAISIRWRDVDLTSSKATITMGKLGGVQRIAHLPPELVAALANIPSNRNDDDQVFPYSSYRACAQPWDVAIRRAGIQRLTAHCCRHGFATSLLHAGIDPITVAKLGGWKDAAQLFKTYGHPMDDETLTNVLTATPVTQVKKRKQN